MIQSYQNSDLFISKQHESIAYQTHRIFKTFQSKKSILIQNRIREVMSMIVKISDFML